MGTLIIHPMTEQQINDEKARREFLDSVSVSELDPIEAEIALMQMFPKLVPVDIILE
jgi:hypothetical protein